LNTANEVFASEVYTPPSEIPRLEVRRVVDLGANVGYTLLYWLRCFPNARVSAYEPHPVHARIIRHHLELNDLQTRVDLHEVAAGTTPGLSSLTDQESASTILKSAAASAGAFQVSTIDVFTDLLSSPIDLLKIDIEGSEYPILNDERFASVNARAIVLEWHSVPGPQSGPQWCCQRLKEIGYQVRTCWEFANFGHIWGIRPVHSCGE
jgi:FkbM family methyltransferase